VVVSCETFTCPYGFPAAHHKRELASDLRLLADAVLAQGVNHVVWHGMPYTPRAGRTPSSPRSTSGPTPPSPARSRPSTWARRDGDELILFFAHPGARMVRYPMRRGQARALPATTRTVCVHADGRRHEVVLEFPPARSILLRVAADRGTPIDLGPGPPDPEEEGSGETLRTR
jgi:hypothetical protein